MRILRHAEPEKPAPYLRRSPDESREPFQRLGPGFHREPWIPAFAGMTVFMKAVVYGQILIKRPPLLSPSKDSAPIF
jgi:hypothetical protein